jgi:hypothetical protein
MKISSSVVQLMLNFDIDGRLTRMTYPMPEWTSRHIERTHFTGMGEWKLRNLIPSPVAHGSKHLSFAIKLPEREQTPSSVLPKRLFFPLGNVYCFFGFVREQIGKLQEEDEIHTQNGRRLRQDRPQES